MNDDPISANPCQHMVRFFYFYCQQPANFLILLLIIILIRSTDPAAKAGEIKITIKSKKLNHALRPTFSTHA